jgi:hypothetical protein
MASRSGEVLCVSAWSKPTYLSLDELRADPSLARLLPAELAYRFHALPVAEQDGRITVVMADPDNREAVSAITGILGREPCVVQGDLHTIDALLARVWGHASQARLKLLACAPEGSSADDWQAYGRSLGELLNAEVTQAACAAVREAWGEGREEPACDLLLVGEADGGLVGTWLAATASQGVVPAALLVAPRLRWPLAKILLIAGGEGHDAAAADWVLRLARPGAGAVSVLAVVPPPAALHEGHRGAMPRYARDRQGLPALLSAGTHLGHELQEVAHRLGEQEIQASLRMRQGPPEWQIRRELAGEDYDLVVMAAQPGCEREGRWDELSAALLRWNDGPTLLTRSFPAMV